MSNVRSLPPCIPSGGQASNFPFRKGHCERPSRIMAVERKEQFWTGLGPWPCTTALQDLLAYLLDTLTPSSPHSLTSAFLPNTALNLAGYGPWSANSMRGRLRHYTKNPTNES